MEPTTNLAWPVSIQSIVTSMFRNDELSWFFINRFRYWILFAENSKIFLKISVIPILFYFHVSGST